MRQIDQLEGLHLALDALHADRLALMCGAGLSMAAPSNLPSAAMLAVRAKAKYDATHGADRPPLASEIEKQAEFFCARQQLSTVYLRTLVDPDSFAGPPNTGHTAAADLLLIRGIQTTVSTNVDSIIETAGMMLFGQVGVGVDGNSVAALLPDRAPLLKLHGCWSTDRANTVWAAGQLAVEPIASRIASSAEWLSVRLLDRDLLIVGYWTDWDYLNDVLERTLGRVSPARVIVVDPCDPASFQAKAPVLYALGHRATVEFCHVRESGHTFLDRLRLDFSRGFVRRVLHTGRQAYHDSVGHFPDIGLTEPPMTDNESYWRIRRDLEGRRPNEPARERTPPEEPLLGLTLLQLRAKGATIDGPLWRVGTQRIRVVRTPNQALHLVQAAYAGDLPPVVAPDMHRGWS